MTTEDLVNLMDDYMNNGGYYLKPKLEDERDGYFLAMGNPEGINVPRITGKVTGEADDQGTERFVI